MKLGHNIGESDGVPIQSPLLLQQENARLLARIAELERQVIRDTLTPLYNRRHFIDILDRWCWRAHRYGGQYGLLFIDVDNLKTINDTHGHSAGDAILISIANALLASVRRSDVVARIGGDEFAILLDNLPLERLTAKVEQLSRSVKRIAIDHGDHRLTASISIGCTPLEAGVSSTELLSRADRAMYQAKSARSDP